MSNSKLGLTKPHMIRVAAKLPHSRVKRFDDKLPEVDISKDRQRYRNDIDRRLDRLRRP